MEQLKREPLERKIEKLSKDVEEQTKIAESEEIKKLKEQKKTVSICWSNIYLRTNQQFVIVFTWHFIVSLLLLLS